MALFLYALTLREQAFEDLQDLPKSASLLRRSAGVFNYLSTEILPLLQHIYAQEKPPEVTTNVSSAMSCLCLAEAQAVSVKFTEKTNKSASLLAKLHYGVTQFLDEASTLLSGSRDVSGKFTDFLYSCKNLHELKSRQHLAESYKEAKQMGVAIGLLNRALTNKNNIPGNQIWRGVLKNEVNEISELLKRYKKENEFIDREKVPLDFELPVMKGEKIVISIPYEPEKWERQLAFK